MDVHKNARLRSMVAFHGGRSFTSCLGETDPPAELGIEER